MRYLADDEPLLPQQIMGLCEIVKPLLKGLVNQGVAEWEVIDVMVVVVAQTVIHLDGVGEGLLLPFPCS